MTYLRLTRSMLFFGPGDQELTFPAGTMIVDPGPSSPVYHVYARPEWTRYTISSDWTVQLTPLEVLARA